MSNQHPDVSDATRAAERDDARAEHDSDREPTPEEEALAETRDVDPEVRERYEDMMERGAAAEGEGHIP